MSPVDTVYEFGGFSLAAQLQSLFSGFGLPLLVALAGTAALVHALASERARTRDLVVHVLVLGLLAWLLAPARDAEVPAPRFLAWLGRAADLVQHRAIARIHGRFLETPFGWERLAAMASHGRIHDPDLGASFARFLESCAKPALAAAAPSGDNLLRPGALAYPDRCERERDALWTRIREHVDRHPLHRGVIDAAARHDGAGAFLERYLDRVVARAIDAPGSPASEAALVAASLGEYAHLDPAQSTGGVPGWVEPLLGSWAGPALDAAISAVAQLHQNWSNRFAAKQKYYLAVALGPHVYGFALLLLLGLFPAVGLFALLPGHAGALLNYAKVFVSVKFWPVCWAALTQFNQKRSSLEALDPAPRGSGSEFFAVAAMYALTPAVAFLAVHLAAAAAAMPFALPSTAGPGLGPAGPALAVARAGK